MKGFSRPYYWVRQKKLFRLHFKFPTEMSSQGRETKPPEPNEQECSCSSVSDVPLASSPITRHSSCELLTTVKGDQDSEARLSVTHIV